MNKVFKLLLKGQKFSKKNLKFLFFYKINKQKITKKKAVNFLFGEKKICLDRRIKILKTLKKSNFFFLEI